MVVHVPFVWWDIISHGANDSAEPRVYYLETAQREKVVCAIAIRGEGNHMTYRPLDSFLQEYNAVLPSSRILEWNFRLQLAAWLDGIVYYSFLQCSEEGTIEAAVFLEIAEIIYGITGANIASTAPGESLPVKLLHKLNEPKNSSITLRAYMYSYAGITQLNFIVHSMSIETPTKKLASTAETLALPPPTPTKKQKANTPSASEDPAETNPAKKQKLNTNEET